MLDASPMQGYPEPYVATTHLSDERQFGAKFPVYGNKTAMKRTNLDSNHLPSDLQTVQSKVRGGYKSVMRKPHSISPMVSPKVSSPLSL